MPQSPSITAVIAHGALVLQWEGPEQNLSHCNLILGVRSADGYELIAFQRMHGQALLFIFCPWVQMQTLVQPKILIVLIGAIALGDDDCSRRSYEGGSKEATEHAGNGAMLVELFRRGFRRTTGSDYSQASLSLAAAVLQRNDCMGVILVHDDITDSRLAGPFDLLLDKGTYDAVGLSAHAQDAKRAYRHSAARLLQANGLLVITSCNSTVKELRHDFEETCASDEASTEMSAFQYLDHVRTYPTFKFGGVEGSHHCTVAFIHC